MKIVIGISGASGVDYAYTLLKNLKEEVHLIISEDAKKVIASESERSPKEFEGLAKYVYKNTDLEAPIASGSSKFDAMVIVPCSTSTLSKIAWGISDNLITRTASVCLKDRRKLILVPRETPLSPIHLNNMHSLAVLGVIILPAMPGFYIKPKKIQDLRNFIAGKIMDQLGLEHNLYKEWRG